MTPVDWTIVAIYALSTLVLGWWFGRKQSDTQEYFTGSGRMNPALIGVSLFATLLSTITYLATPGEVFGKGPAYLAYYLCFPFVYLVVGYVVLPVYMQYRVSSAYELLEGKLGRSIRLLGASLFLCLRLVWMSLLIFLTAKAIAVMIGAPESAIFWIVAATGAFAVFYTTLGGLRAVVVTDSIQTLLLYGGALLVLAMVTIKSGGFAWFSAAWDSSFWDHQPVFSLDPSVRVTVFGSILSMFLWNVCTSVGDQVSVQRFMATEDARAARRAIGLQLGIGALVGLTLGMVGLALLGYYRGDPSLVPEGIGLKEFADKAFPLFIAEQLPPVVTGLVMCGLFAAAMSSIDSGVNSITAVVLNDFLAGKRKRAPERDVHFARCIALAVGTIVVVLSTTMKHIPGNFLAVTSKTVNLLTVPIALLFVFALWVPFANARGVWFGTLCSVAAAVLVAFSGTIFGTDPTTGADPVSFQWISPVALVVGLVAGLTACKIFSPRSTS